jgi:hypothetical protein
MGLIGLLGALTVIAVVALWMTMKAVMTQIQATQADVETDAPGLLYRRSYSIFKIVVGAILVIELWPGLSTWAYDAWTYVPI